MWSANFEKSFMKAWQLASTRSELTEKWDGSLRLGRFATPPFPVISFPLTIEDMRSKKA
jgi:hypothetical protein